MEEKFSYAVLQRSLQFIRKLITNVVPRVVEGNYNTFLHFGDVNNDVEMMNKLLERHSGNKVPIWRNSAPFVYYVISNKKGYSKLLGDHFKHGKETLDCEIWNMEVVKYLSRRDRVNSLNSSPLWLPVAKRDIKMVKLLLESGANTDNKDINRKVLHAAVFCVGKHYSEIVEILLQNGFTVNPEDVHNPPFFYTAVEKGYLKIVVALLKYGVDVNMKFSSDQLSPLHVAVKSKQEEIAKLLISYAADVNAKDDSRKTPIFYAIENGDLNMTKLLLNHRAIARATSELLNVAQSDVDINAADIKGRTPLHRIAVKYPFGVGKFSLVGPHKYNVYKEIVKLLLNRGANINAVTISGFTAFELSIRGNHVESLEALLDHVDVNSAFADEMTPLHCSARGGHVVITKMLLSKGANVNATLKLNNSTPLHFAVYKGHKEITEVLLRCGARVGSKIISDITPKDCSIFNPPLTNNHLEIFEVLIENGADINSRNEFNGRTVLHNVVKYDPTRNVIALLNFGADINIENKAQCSQLSLANREATVVLHRHITKLKAANLYLSKKILGSLSFVKKNTQIRVFQNECNEEISRMKSEYIANTNASFYDILSRHVSSLALYAGNNDILQALESDDYKIKFPIYASMIECNFKRGKRRKRFSERIYTFFDTISNDFLGLPYVCLTKILSYLSEEDLRNLRLSFRNEDERKDLLEQGYQYFHFLFINTPGFLYKFTEKIFSYLSNDDLRNLVEACKSDKICDNTFPPLRSPN